MNVQSPIRNIEATAPRATPPKKQRGRRWVMLAAILCVLLGAGLYWYYSNANSGGPQPIIVTATRGDVEDVVTAVGNLTPLTSVDVGAQVSGQLETLHVKIGDDVTKGQILAEIDSSVMAAKVDAGKAQLQNLQAQLAEKQSQLGLAHVQADRQQKLFDIGGTSRDLLDQAQAASKLPSPSEIRAGANRPVRILVEGGCGDAQLQQDLSRRWQEQSPRSRPKKVRP
jgi:multidrug efflux pump subunit AcrA (membrane-fusion protein)